MRAPKHMTAFAKRLRHDQTDAETLLWSRLRAERCGFKFRRQVPVSNYILDFMCFELGVCVELDGGQHYDDGEAEAADRLRDEVLTLQGICVLRFANNELMANLDAAVELIVAACEERVARGPLPWGEGG
jgi:very-short-patch-repair endonuclease